jgi:predicted Zn-dependent peptidase
VLKRGSKRYPTQKDINIRLDELYSSSVSPFFRHGAIAHKMGFTAEMLATRYSDADTFSGSLELLFDMFWNPLLDENGYFTSKNVEESRRVICDSIKSVINNPKRYAVKRLFEIMYEDDLYFASSNGTVDLIQSVTDRELIEAYYDLVKNSSYEIFYTGTKSAEEIEAAVLPYFEKYKYGAAQTIEGDVTFDVDTKKVKRVNEEMKLSQGKLVMGFKTGVNITCGKDFYAMMTLNEIYGASPISKLFMNVREKLGLCYYCSSAYGACKGCIHVSSGIEKDDLKKAEKVILKQLDDIKKGKITDFEFNAAKKSLINAHSEITDSAAVIERYYLVNSEFSVNDSIEDAKRKFAEVSLEDVIRVAQNIKLDTVYFLSGKGGEEEEFDD